MNKEKILVVDDDSDARKGIVKSLKADGYDIHDAENGEQALEMIKVDSYDLVLTDLKMSEIDGVGVLEEVKKKDPSCPVIIMTSYGSIETDLQAKKTGVSSFFTKPVNMDRLRLKIKKILEDRKLEAKIIEPDREITDSEITREVSSKLMLGTLLGIIVKLTCDILNADGGTLLLIEDDSLVMKAATENFKDEIWRVKIKPGKGVIGRVAEKGKPALVKDGLNDEPCFSEFKVPQKIGSGISVPLFEGNKPIGVLNLSRREGKPEFNKEDFFAAETFNAHIVFSLKNAIAYTELMKAKLYIDNIIGSMLDTLIVTDSKAVITTLNKATLELLGYKEEEVIGKHVGMLFEEEEFIFRKDEFDRLIKEGISRNYDVTYKTKFGERIPATLSASAMRDKEGKVIGVVCVVRDMREIRELQLQIFQQERLASVGELAAGLAHEVGNPLQTILGNAELILMNNKFEEARAIKKAVLYCKRIIENLLDFSRQKEINFINDDINDLIEKTLSLYGKQLEIQKIKIVKHYADLPTLLLSSSHMEQVFLNLITNAQKAMPEGGTLTISTRVKRSASNAQKGDFVEISFKDTGMGITKKNLNVIFEPFFTTYKRGTGLGLSVSYGIVKQHNGQIFALSEGKEKGSEFVIRLPVGK
ncbi:MAG: response regulator [Elusimicrobia bacterium]|nr:response regulator [Elusimicrobiota bacterium]